MPIRSLIAPLLGAAGLALPAGAKTSYPLMLRTCGVEVTFDAAPPRVASLGQAATEIHYSLGRADRMAGTAVWFTAVLPEFAEANGRVERRADSHPAFERVVAKRPGLDAVQTNGTWAPQGIVARVSRSPTWGSPPTSCPPIAPARTTPWARTAMFTMEGVCRGNSELGRIFGKPARAADLVGAPKEREAAAIAKARALD